MTCNEYALFCIVLISILVSGCFVTFAVGIIDKIDRRLSRRKTGRYKKYGLEYKSRWERWMESYDK